MKVTVFWVGIVCCHSLTYAEERSPSLISPAAAARLEREMENRPLTVAEKLAQARRRHLFTIGSTPDRQDAEETKTTRYSAALRNFREASAELFDLTFRFVITWRAFFILGTLVVIGVFRAVSG